MRPARMMVRAVAPLLLIFSAPEAASAGAEGEVSLPLTGSTSGQRLGLGLQLGSRVRNDRLQGGLRGTSDAEAKVSMPLDPDAGGLPRLGLGPQIGAFVRHEVALSSNVQETGGELSLPLSPAEGEALGLGLGPQISSRVWTKGEASTKGREDVDSGAQVSMPLTPEAFAAQGKTLGLGPQLDARVSPPGDASISVWYVYMFEWFSMSNTRFFQLCLLANVLVLMAAFYCNPLKTRAQGANKQRLFGSRWGAAEHHSSC